MAGLALLLGAFLCTLVAQPRFDVVAIHITPPNAKMILRDIDFQPVLPGGRYSDERTSLPILLAFAYNANYSRIEGLPNWAEKLSFALSAKAADGFPQLSVAENREQVRLMMRALLADRFHLKIHNETRNTKVLRLEVEKGGIKIPEVPAPMPPEKEGYVGFAGSDHDGRLIGNKVTMARVALAINPWMGRPVSDETGSKGYYDFNLSWLSKDPDASKNEFEAEGQSLLIEALREKLGLRLVNGTAPLQYWIVDQVEQPGAN